MIICCNMRQLASVHADTQYAIVRSLTKPIRNTEQLAVLSPSKNLFFEYLRYSKAGEWNKEKFDTWYTPIFLREMQSPAAQAKLDELAQRSANGEKIALACFCTDPETCHRSLVAKLLAERGAEVQVI